MNQFVRFPGFKRKAVTLSYDDGSRHDKRLISILQKHGLKATFNINSGFFSEKYEGIEKGRMTRQEALALYPPSGMEVAVHGYQHFSLAHVDTNLAINDIFTDRKELENLFGCVINGMAYANGSYNEEVITVLKKMGIEWARTADESESLDLPSDWLKWQGTCHHDNPRLMEIAKQFVEQRDAEYFWLNQLQLFYLWGHSYEFAHKNNWNVIEEFAEYIGNREDIWYATNGEIFDYLQAAERLQFSADGSLVKNPSGIDIYLQYIDKKRKVPAGKTIKLHSGAVL